jgi:pimeloyl-ACP methyl ester carboxylesterase
MIQRSIVLGVMLCAAPLSLAAQAPPGVRDVVMQFTATDGTPLEAKLSLPADATGPVPVVFFLHGAGPRNYDNAVQYRDADGRLRIVNYYDYYAREQAKHGIAFFRMSKRGCTVGPNGRPQVDRAVFSKATSTVLVNDYAVALTALRARAEIDASRVILAGSSEGTRLAPHLALRAPAGIIGLVLTSYQGDNIRDTVTWQNTHGPWRIMSSMIPGAKADARTRAEWDAAVSSNPALTQQVPFPTFDADKDGVMTESEVRTVISPRLGVVLKAIEDGNDDFIWQTIVNLSSGYMRDGWTDPPTSEFLLKLKVPVGIFHGELDGTTRVEAVRETEAAFKAAGRSDLTVKTYAGLEHNLGWTPQGASGDGPAPFQDGFAFASELVKRSRR